MREEDPFAAPSPLRFAGRPVSPYVSRLQLQWRALRTQVLEHFPAPLARPDKASYLRAVQDAYQADAYHSLSIEGYQVSDALIERVRTGDWNPERNEEDRRNRNALAARGYWQAFQRVAASVERVLEGANAGEIADRDHQSWYQELFGPSVVAGILKPGDLAGYRNGPVYIRRSLHVPPPHEAVRDMLPEFFALLGAEPEPAVRVVLGHFFFVYAHPVLRRQWPRGTLPDESDGGIGRLALDAGNGADARGLHVSARAGERAPGHRAVHALPGGAARRIGARHRGPGSCNWRSRSTVSGRAALVREIAEAGFPGRRSSLTSGRGSSPGHESKSGEARQQQPRQPQAAEPAPRRQTKLRGNRRRGS